jgi:LacI family transcriptional regulator
LCNRLLQPVVPISYGRRAASGKTGGEVLPAGNPGTAGEGAVVRLEDVARAAGVSKATASRALTRARVTQLAEEMGLRLNPTARALYTGRTGALALVVPSLTNPYFGPILAGAQRELADRGGHALIAAADTATDEIDLAHSLFGHVDATVLIAPRAPDERIRALAEHTRLVVVDRYVEGVPGVVADTPHGVGLLVEHLTALGHRHLGYIGGPGESSLDGQRIAAARRGAEATGATLEIVAPVPPELDTGLRLSLDWPFGPAVSAVIAYSSYLALGLLIGLRERGVAVPDEISVAAVDQLAAVASQPTTDPHPATAPATLLTCLRVPLEQLGRTAADTALRPDGGGEAAEQGAAADHSGVTALRTTLVPGRSTAAPPATTVARRSTGRGN